MNDIPFNCPHCGKYCLAPVELAGSTAQCSKCSGFLEVPREDYDGEIVPGRNSVFWLVMIVFVVLVHVAIYWGAASLWQESRSGNPWAVIAGLAGAFLGAFALLAIVVSKRK